MHLHCLYQFQLITSPFCIFIVKYYFSISYYWESSVRITVTCFCSCLMFCSFSRCVLKSFFLSWPTQTNCCPTWVPLTCPTTAVMTCCPCLRTTDHHHLVTAVNLPVEDSTVSVGTNYVCVCACEWVSARDCLSVNVYGCLVVVSLSFWSVLLYLDIHSVQYAGMEGPLLTCEQCLHRLYKEYNRT